MKIIALLGPTGVGKTKVSILLAKKLNAVIINADSTQIYKELNIGVSKITEKEKQGIKHYMLDIVSIFDKYTVRDYQKDAREILDKLIKENRNVIIVGGSNLYIKALLYDYKFTDEEESFDYPELSNLELKTKVDEIYKDNNIHINNRKRLVRFLSHYESTKEVIKNTSGKDTPLYDFTLIGLTTSKENLHKKIDERVEEMLCDGLLEECKHLLEINALKAKEMIGYKEFMGYYNKEITFEEALKETKTRTKKYAKRQYTWCRNQFKNVKWFNVEDIEDTTEKIEDYLASK